MKNLATLLAFIFVTAAFSQTKSQAKLFDEQLNQFLNVRDFTKSKNGNEVYFTIQSPNGNISKIAYMKKQEDKWSKPELLLFGDSFTYLEPFLSPDDKKLYFVSNRSIQGVEKKDVDIWYIERENGKAKWSVPKNVGAPVNSELDEFYPAITQSGNLYFTMVAPEGIGKDDLYMSKWNGNSYEKPVILNKNINTEGYEFNAYVAPDESFIIYTKYNAEDGFGSGDLYLSKNTDGNWQAPINLGEAVNTRFMEYCPFYDAQNKLLYFTSRRDILEPKVFKDLEEFQEYVNQGANGLSKIYSVPLVI